MAAINYAEEMNFLQKYMDAKNGGQGGLDQMIEQIITHYLIPQSRFVEANSWLPPISDEKLLAQLKLMIANEEIKADLPKINRLPKYKDWINSDIASESKTTDSQQYHYDRLISYFNYQQTLLKDKDDIFECRNEWITFMCYSTWGTTGESKMGSRGCLFTTLATAYHDYFENILLPNKFLPVELPNQSEEVANVNTVEHAYAQVPDTIKYFNDYHPTLLKEGFCMNFFADIKILGASEEILITDNYVAFLPSKKKGWGSGPGIIVNRANVTEISVGSEDHIEYQGISSSETFYWTLTFETTNYQRYTRYLYLGRNEREMNENRPKLGSYLQKLGQYFNLVEGDSYASSGGYTTSFGFGWWV